MLTLKLMFIYYAYNMNITPGFKLEPVQKQMHHLYRE